MSDMDTEEEDDDDLASTKMSSKTSFDDEQSGEDYDDPFADDDDGFDEFEPDPFADDPLDTGDVSEDDVSEDAWQDMLKEMDLIGEAQKTSAQNNYKIMDPDQVSRWLQMATKALSLQMGISESNALRAIRYLNYDMQAAMIISTGGADTLSTLWEEKIFVDDPEYDDKPGDLVECPVCQDDFKPSEMFSLPCKHRFCKDCIGAHVKMVAQSKLRMQAINLACPLPFCSGQIPANVIEKYAGKMFIDKRREWAAHELCQKSEYFQMCPNDFCKCCMSWKFSEKEVLKMVFSHDSLETAELECLCGQAFCWRCGFEAHSPCSCDEVADWKDMSNEDDALERLKSMCKICPGKGCGYGTMINAKTACNHMTCTACGHEWCWMCYGPWSSHGSDYYSCKVYNSGGAKKAQAENSARELKLATIGRLKEFEEKITPLIAGSTGKAAKKLEDEMTKLRQHLDVQTGLTLAQTRFLKDAGKIVIAIKRMLKWGWVYLYFLPEIEGDSERELFVHQHSKMSQLGNQLHEMLMPDKNNNKKEYKDLSDILGLDLDKCLMMHMTKPTETKVSMDERQAHFQEFRMRVSGFMKQLKHFAQRVVNATGKGLAIADPEQRAKNHARAALARIQSVDWSWKLSDKSPMLKVPGADADGWHHFPQLLAASMELRKIEHTQQFFGKEVDGYVDLKEWTLTVKGGEKAWLARNRVTLEVDKTAAASNRTAQAKGKKGRKTSGGLLARLFRGTKSTGDSASGSDSNGSSGLATKESCDASAATSPRSFAGATLRLRRKVKATTMKNKDSWLCKHADCPKQGKGRTSNVNNTCIWCGKVKNH